MCRFSLGHYKAAHAAKHIAVNMVYMLRITSPWFLVNARNTGQFEAQRKIVPRGCACYTLIQDALFSARYY